MVLPPPAPDLEEGARAALGKLRRLLSLGRAGTLIFAVGGDAWVGRLWRGLADVDGVRWPAATPMEIPDAPDGAFVLCQALPSDAEWLNMRRPVFEGRGLRVVMLVSAETRRHLRRHARDFFDWVSHSVELPDVPHWHVIASLRAGLVGNIGYRGDDPIRILRWVTSAPVRERSAEDAWDAWRAERTTTGVLIVRDATAPEEVGWVQRAAGGRAGILFCGGAFVPSIEVPTKRWREVAAPGVEGARIAAVLDLEVEAIHRVGQAPLDELAEDPAAAWARRTGVTEGLIGIRADPRAVTLGPDEGMGTLLDAVSGYGDPAAHLESMPVVSASDSTFRRVLTGIARARSLAKLGQLDASAEELRGAAAELRREGAHGDDARLALSDVLSSLSGVEADLGDMEAALEAATAAWEIGLELLHESGHDEAMRSYAASFGLRVATLRSKLHRDPLPIIDAAVALLQPLLVRESRSVTHAARVEAAEMAVRFLLLRPDRVGAVRVLEEVSGDALQVLTRAADVSNVQNAANVLQLYVDTLYASGDAAAANSLVRRFLRALRRREGEDALASVLTPALEDALVSATAAALAVGDVEGARSASTELRTRRKARLGREPGSAHTQSDVWVADLLAAEVELASGRGDRAEALLREAEAGLNTLVDAGAVDTGSLRRLAFAHEKLAAVGAKGNAAHAEAALALRRRALAADPTSETLQEELGVTLSMMADALGEAGAPARAEAAALLVPLWRRGVLLARHVPLAEQLAAVLP